MLDRNINIAIAEDHPTFLLGLERSFASQQFITVIAKAANGHDLLEVLKTQTPDVILMDINMPRLNGIETAIQVRQQYPGVKIIFITMHEDESVVKQCILHGDGYLSKSTTSDELIKAIEKVMVNGSYFSDIKPNEYVADVTNNAAEPKLKLTKRELEMITFLSKGYTTKQIAQQLFLSHLTIETHRKNILRKLQVKNIAELISFAITHNIN